MIGKTNIMTTFGKLGRTEIFATDTTLYTKSDGAEDPKEHIFQKIGKNKAILMPERSVIVHFLENKKVSLCVVENTRIAIK